LSLKYLPAIYIRSHSALAFIRQYFHIQPPLFLRDALHSDQISFFSAISCSFPIKKAGQTAGYTFQCKANLVLPKIITIQFSPLLGTQSTLSPWIWTALCNGHISDWYVSAALSCTDL